LPDEHIARLNTCHAVVASKRFLSVVAGMNSTVIQITPLDGMIRKMGNALQHGNVAVLASGDPLFYGIGRTLLDNFASEKLKFYPALSAMQQACARFKVPWDDAVLLSLHGRDTGGLAGRILPHKKVILFTDQHNSPSRIAQSLLTTLQELGHGERLQSVRVRVAEDLGLVTEKLTDGSLADIAGKEFSPLNMMLVEQDYFAASATGFLFGLQEQEITHSRGLITKDEVRAAVLHCLRLPQNGVFWDVGGGSGSISVEAARLCPELQIFTVEQKTEAQENIQTNRARYDLYNMQLVSGKAPDIFKQLPRPERVFIGGSGGELAAIIAASADQLRIGGRIVASAVLASTAEQAPLLMEKQGLEVDVRTISVTRYAGSDRAEQKLNSITIITGKK
jgi:precorrin-6Y C5,15-methyltransferase (decarboxylating)